MTFVLFSGGLTGVYAVQYSLGLRSLEYVLTYSTTAIIGSFIGISLIYVASRVHRGRTARRGTTTVD